MQFTRRAVLLAGAVLPFIDAARAFGPDTTLIDAVRSRVLDVMQAGGVPGAAAALVVDGEPVWVESFGSTKDHGTQPIGVHTIFSLQSCSKSFTATAVMIAVQRGLVNLDAAITTYIPEFKVNSRLETEPQKKITVRMLLNHTAGFTHEAPIGNNFVDGDWTFATHLRSIQETWLRYPVGERFAYSNLGLDLAAQILERVSGMSYGECLKSWLLTPLSMSDTTAVPDEYEARSDRALGHAAGLNDIPVRVPLLGSGGVYSSITDMTRYAAFHMAEGRIGDVQVLDTALWREMYDFRYGSNYALGMGGSLEIFNKESVRIFGHDGGGYGFGCSFNHCPSEGVAWIVLFNGTTKPTANFVASLSSFDGILLDPILKSRNIVPVQPAPYAGPIIAVPPETLQRWVGSYLNGDAQIDMSIEEGSLGFRVRGDNTFYKLAFTAADEAWVVGGPPQTVRFHHGAGLEVQHIEGRGGSRWDFNDGPSVEFGPVGNEYDDKLGTYEIDKFGARIATAVVSKRNGYVYYDDIRWTPYQLGLLFSGDGEVLDLRGEVLISRNIPLKRVTT